MSTFEEPLTRRAIDTMTDILRHVPVEHQRKVGYLVTAYGYWSVAEAHAIAATSPGMYRDHLLAHTQETAERFHRMALELTEEKK